ncbi:hypothetical protein GLYMA_13G337532v4 [Glycine max]|nr:hypothetical protein GLYMA_13G337532v4 [Glycine max]KAH1104722.1 hypothetical protein GYH30_038203 [Glycine max]
MNMFGLILLINLNTASLGHFTSTVSSGKFFSR